MYIEKVVVGINSALLQDVFVGLFDNNDLFED